MEEGEQDKSEQATPYKLQRARREGSVARGMDLGFFTGLAAGVAALWLLGPGLGRRLAAVTAETLVTAPEMAGGPYALLWLIGSALTATVPPLALVTATIFLTVLAFELVQTGLVFSGQPLKPDFKRLNPAANLKRLVSPKLLIETAKNVLKLAVYAAIAAVIVVEAAGSAAAAIIDARSLAAAMTGVGLRLLGFFALAALGFAAVDQLIVRRDFGKRMRMSRREVRREHKDREGDPRLKRRRKELHGQFAKLSQSLRGVRGADVLITNPTHYAVALRYDAATMAAPTVVAQGAHQIAQRLKRLAFLYGVTIVQDPALARALYRAPLGEEIPGPLYAPVAALYRTFKAGEAQAAHA